MFWYVRLSPRRHADRAFRQAVADVSWPYRAAQLAQSVYGLLEQSKLKRILRVFNNVGKGVSVGLPLITILSLRSSALHSDLFAFLLVADLPCE